MLRKDGTLTIPDLQLSTPVCMALRMLCAVFGDLQSFETKVIEEVERTARTQQFSSSALFNILKKLVNEWEMDNPEKAGFLNVSTSQLMYSTKLALNRQSKRDREFQCIIKPSHDRQALVMIWTVNSADADRNSFSIRTIDGFSWQFELEMISEKSRDDPMSLVQAGGEIIGFLAQNKILSPGSQLNKAAQAHLELMGEMRSKV